MPRYIRTLLSDLLDTKLPSLQKATQVLTENTPKTGWINQIRSALGMSEEALAKRLEIKRASIQEIERNERSGKVTLQTLRRAARALDAELVYAIIPRRPISETIAARARALALERLAPISHSMAMEDQALSNKQLERRLDDLANDLAANERDLWR